MKKLVIALFAVCAIFSSCQKTPEDKANDLIKENITKMLTYPDSYESVETTIDSLFTPMYTVAFYEKSQRAMELIDRIVENKRKVANALFSMHIHSGIYSNSAYYRAKYKEGKEEYEIAKKYNEKAVPELESLNKEMKAQLEKGDEFLGYAIEHKFRCKNEGGNTTKNDFLLIVDKDMNEVIMSFNLNSLEFRRYYNFCDRIMDDLPLYSDINKYVR